MAPATIVIVDSDEDSRTIYSVLLESVGYAVRACSDADEARRVTVGVRPALVITELNLRGLDPNDLARSLIPAEDSTIPPLLLVTADSSAHVREYALGGGYEAAVLKPVDPTSLLDLIRKLAGPPESIAE